MESKSCQVPQETLLQHFGNLRKMIVHNHELENLSEFVLHDICVGSCFHVDKAAYFINNPDFKLLRGITGYSKQEPQAQLRDAWNNQKQFIASMKDSAFNQKVRGNQHQNFERGKNSEKYMVEKLADQLEIENPAYHVWDLKHANHGLLIYEPLLHDADHAQDYHLDSLYYLSFCPVY
jgi:hypothetical protein